MICFVIGCLIVSNISKRGIPNHFRISNMGELTEQDMIDLIAAVRKACYDMRMDVPITELVF